ncbi:NAD(P)-binding protein [Priestia endophytica]|uniref:NAD(P)-binding protein n=1 Tax=Priestia endophytica TaxID=135735 RepID=UPI0022826B9D|nr:NAD(P)-binding protein [Priestia endophytica]
MLVGIIGGGIGGLTLAQALREANINVIIFERDQKPTQTGGYRLHLHRDALNALRKVLPHKLMEALLSSGTGKESFTKFSLLDHHGNTKLSFPVEEEEVLMIGRVPLRTILASNLKHIVRWNTAFSHYEKKVLKLMY